MATIAAGQAGESYQRTAASFIWAHIEPGMYEARRSGLRKMFGYVRRGYRTVIGRLEEKLVERVVEIETLSHFGNQKSWRSIQDSNGRRLRISLVGRS